MHSNIHIFNLNVKHNFPDIEKSPFFKPDTLQYAVYWGKTFEMYKYNLPLKAEILVFRHKKCIYFIKQCLLLILYKSCFLASY